ncbi:MAG TPA: hypothetical protein VFW23_10615, partial [Tepidisphaeraceae bacterium]|nr:hypothetical protein [Tepidisphaeraceae bacterium]
MPEAKRESERRDQFCWIAKTPVNHDSIDFPCFDRTHVKEFHLCRMMFWGNIGSAAATAQDNKSCCQQSAPQEYNGMSRARSKRIWMRCWKKGDEYIFREKCTHPLFS